MVRSSQASRSIFVRGCAWGVLIAASVNKKKSYPGDARIPRRAAETTPGPPSPGMHAHTPRESHPLHSIRTSAHRPLRSIGSPLFVMGSSSTPRQQWRLTLLVSALLLALTAVRAFVVPAASSVSCWLIRSVLIRSRHGPPAWAACMAGSVLSIHARAHAPVRPPNPSLTV